MKLPSAKSLLSAGASLSAGLSAGLRSAITALRALLARALRTRLRRRVAIACGAVVLGCVVGIAAAVLLLMWRLSEGPIRLEALDTTIEQAVARELGDVTVEIMGAELAREPDGGTVVRLADVTIRDLSGQFLARAPQAVVETNLVSAALGSVIATGIELIGPHVSVRRHLDGTVSLGFRPPPQPGAVGSDESSGEIANPPVQVASAASDAGQAFSPLSVFQQSPDGDGFLNTVNRLLVRNARLTLFDEASQSVWDSYNATLRITRPRGGLAVYVDAPFSTDTGEWRFRSTVEQDRSDSPILVEAEFDSVVPSEIAARIPALTDLASIDLPVSGRIEATLTPDGNITAVAGDIALGAGFLNRIPFADVAISPQLVDEGRVTASYNREENKLDLHRLSLQFGSNRIALSGTLSPEHDDAGTLVAARFDVRSENLTIASADIGREPAVIKRALASGRIMLDRSGIEVDTVIADFPHGQITLGASMQLAPVERLSLQGTMENIDADTLAQIWPGPLAPGGRSWISQHVTKGNIRTAQFRVDLGPDEIAAIENGTAIAEDAVQVEATIDGVTAHYLDPLPPLENGSGTAYLTGDRFVLSIERASAVAPGGAPMAITYGRFDIPTLIENENGAIIGNINVGITSSTSAALAVLDLKPLEFTREIGAKVADARGEVTIIFDLAVPLINDVSFSEVQFQAGATLRDLSVDGAFRGITLGADELEIIATPQRIDARGDVRLNDVPARAVWEIRFDEPGSRTNRLSIETEANADDLNRLGIDLRDYLTGSAPMALEARGHGSRLDTIEVQADVSGAEIGFPAIGWTKPAGEPAKLDFVVERLENEQVRLRELSLLGDRVTVTGAIRFDPDGSVYKVDLSQLKLGSANSLALNGVRRSDGVLQLNVRGSEFDAGELLRREISGEAPIKPEDAARPAEIDFDIDTMRGADGTPLNNAAGRIQIRNGKVAGIRLSGRFASEQSLELNYGVGGGTSPAVVNIETTDAGEFIRFVGLYSRAHGGSMAVRAQGPDARSLAGTILARDFTIRDEPVLVRIAQGRSGLAARAAKTVKFSRLNLEFQRQGGALNIKDALISGPAVGASMRGRVDIAGERLALTGTYIPAYGLNAAFGAIPLFGPILSGRSGEGVFGMTFGVEGEMGNPTITINPVSAIAPGLLRRVFEFRQQ